MEPIITAALISGAMAGGSSLLGGALGRQGQAEANAAQMQFNAQQAQLNREWQEHMASTAYVRAMTDMRNAGLNPILAANLGGAATPGGSTASVSLGNPGAFMQQGVQSAGEAASRAIMARQALIQSDKDASQTELNKAQENATKANEKFTQSNTELNEKNKLYVDQQTITSAANARAADANAAAARARAGLDAANTVNAAVQNEILKSDAVSAKQRAEDLVRHGPPGPVTNVTIPAARMTDKIVKEVQQQQNSSQPSGTGQFPPYSGLRNSPSENPIDPSLPQWQQDRIRRHREKYGTN